MVFLCRKKNECVTEDNAFSPHDTLSNPQASPHHITHTLIAMALFVWGSNASQQLGLGVDDKELYDVVRIFSLVVAHAGHGCWSL